jgi:hypothetical protein
MSESIWSHLFGWGVLFSWIVVGWAEAVLLGAVLAMIGIGYAVPANNSGSWFTGAAICFSAAALLFLLKVAEIAIVMNHPFWERAVFTLALFSAVGLATVEGVRGINRIRPVGLKAQATAPVVDANPDTPRKFSAENQSQQNNNEAHGTTDKVEARPQRHVTKDKAEAKPRNDRTEEHVPTADEIADALAKRLPAPGLAQTNSQAPLKQRVLKLSDDIIDFLRARRKVEPPYEPEREWRVFQEETMEIYKKRFAGQVINAFQDLEKAGVWTGNYDQIATMAVNPLVVEQLAVKMRAYALKLSE